MNRKYSPNSDTLTRKYSANSDTLSTKYSENIDTLTTKSSENSDTLLTKDNFIMLKGDLLLALALGHRVRSRLKSDKGKGLINEIRDTSDLIENTPSINMYYYIFIVDDSNAADFVDSLIQQKAKQTDVYIDIILIYLEII